MALRRTPSGLPALGALGVVVLAGTALADPSVAAGVAPDTVTEMPAADSTDRVQPGAAGADTGADAEVSSGVERLRNFLPPLEPVTPRAALMDWTKTFTSRLSLREFIRTEPVVVGGVKVYVEAEPVAARQRPHSTGQLTFAFAPDRIVVLGAF